MKTQLRFLTVYLTAFLVFLSFALTAQPRQQQQPRSQLFNAIERMASELELTADQQSQLAKLKTSFESDRAKLQNEKAAEPGADRTAFHNLMQAYKASIDEVLTEEQRAKLQQLKQENRGKYQQRGQKVDKQGVRSEMRSYRDENITPVLMNQRAKLETKLSAEDKATLAELRPKMKAAREQLRPQKGQAQTEEARKLREAHQADRDAVKGLMQKYEADIDALMAEVLPQQEQWRQDMREISKKYRPEDGKDSKRYRSGEGNGKKWDGKKGEGKPQGIRQGSDTPHPAMMKGRFLLLDPNQPTGSGTAETQVSNLTAYPNPASNEVGIKYRLEKDANVRIELRDREGKLVKTLNQPNLKAGAQSHTLDVSQLPDGIYYLAVSSQGQQLASKVVVSKK
jgi:periplasmic protein CpxP/Spy